LAVDGVSGRCGDQVGDDLDERLCRVQLKPGVGGSIIDEARAA
jgi:hypothetical protein